MPFSFVIFLLAWLSLQAAQAADEDWDGIDDELTLTSVFSYPLSYGAEAAISKDQSWAAVWNTQGPEIEIRMLERVVEGWEPVGSLISVAEDASGAKVRLNLDGSVLIVSAAGAIFSYRRAGGEWLVEHRFDFTPEEGSQCTSLAAVAMDDSGSRLVLLCRYYTDIWRGAVQVFDYAHGAWIVKGPPFLSTQNHTISSSDISPDGKRLVISSSAVAAGYLARTITYQWKQEVDPFLGSVIERWFVAGQPIEGAFGPALQNSVMALSLGEDYAGIAQGGALAIYDLELEDWKMRSPAVIGGEYEELSTFAKFKMTPDGNMLFTAPPLFLQTFIRIWRDFGWHLISADNGEFVESHGSIWISPDGRDITVVDRYGGNGSAAIRVFRLDGDLYPQDTDNDSLSNVLDADDDNDGVTDDRDHYPLIPIGDLVDTDFDGAPNNCDSACKALGMEADPDDDNDGLSDEKELEFGTDPLKPDSDGDGWSDREEIEEGTNPLSDSSQPELPRGLPSWLLYQAAKISGEADPDVDPDESCSVGAAVECGTLDYGSGGGDAIGQTARITVKPSATLVLPFSVISGSYYGKVGIVPTSMGLPTDGSGVRMWFSVKAGGAPLLHASCQRNLVFEGSVYWDQSDQLGFGCPIPNSDGPLFLNLRLCISDMTDGSCQAPDVNYGSQSVYVYIQGSTAQH